MAGNNFQILFGSVPLGEIIVCDARSLHACMTLFKLQLTFEI